VITNLRGVLLDVDDAAYIAGALEAFARWLAENRSRPTPRLLAVTAQLRKTTQNCAATPQNGRLNGTDGHPASPHGPDFRDDDGNVHYAVVTTGQAARILGVTPNAVRALARRGRLPADRSGGRYLLPARAVVARAEQRAERKAARR
jgi:excisionase family DNA binding protein